MALHKTCPNCLKDFRGGHDYQRHLASCNGHPKQCALCRRWFNTQGERDAHVERSHGIDVINPRSAKVKAFCLVCAGGGKDLTSYGSKKAANIAAVSHMNQYGHRVVLLDKKPTAVNPRTGKTMRVQSLLFDRGVFTAAQARSWAHAHGYKYGDVEIPETGKYIHLRQLAPKGRVKRIIPIGSTLSGIRAIVLRNPLCCPNPVQRFQSRFLTDAQLGELSNLWHLSRTALPKGYSSSRYQRLLWASGAFHKAHPNISATAAYKDLDAMLAFGGR